MTGSRVELNLAGLRRKFNIGFLIQGERKLVKQARKGLSGTKEKKRQKKLVADHKSLEQAMNTGDIDEIVTQFTNLCNLTIEEFRDYENTLWLLIQTIHSEFIRLRQLYERENDTEVRQKLQEDTREILVHAKKWFEQAQQSQSLTFQLSDRESLKAEVTHILDNFNLQRTVKKVRQEERTLSKIVKKKSGGKNSNASKDELKHLNNLIKQLNQELNLEDKAFTDVMKMMQLEQHHMLGVFETILAELKKMEFPNPELVKLQAKASETTRKIITFYNELANRLNSLINVLRTMA